MNSPRLYVRDIPLLQEEDVILYLDPQEGITPVMPEGDRVLVLTTHRVISLTADSGEQLETVASLERVEGVSLRRERRSGRNLYNAGLFLLLALLTYLVVGMFITRNVAIARLAGALVAVVALYFFLRWALWEEQGTLTVHLGGAEITLPFAGQGASRDLGRFVEQLFLAREALLRRRAGTLTALPPASLPTQVRGEAPGAGMGPPPDPDR